MGRDLPDPLLSFFPQPCSLGAEFRCPVVFRQEILVQVIGTVELVGEIKVAGNRLQVVLGGPRGVEGGLPPQRASLHFFVLS